MVKRIREEDSHSIVNPANGLSPIHRPSIPRIRRIRSCPIRPHRSRPRPRRSFHTRSLLVAVEQNMAENIEDILAEIDGSQMEEYQKFFDMFDRGKQGYINATQIGQIMIAMGQEFDEKQLRKLIRKFDADGSGKLEFEEFCALVYTVSNTVDKETLEKELREAFRLFDKEGNGFISRDTLKDLLKEIASDLSDSQLDEAVDEIDEDGSGKIEFAEFWELMAGD